MNKTEGDLRIFNIHGDNILECERTVFLIAESLNTKPKFEDSPIHNPTYSIFDKKQK